MEKVDLLESLWPVLNVKAKQNNFFKIQHSEAKIYDYNGIKFQSVGLH